MVEKTNLDCFDEFTAKFIRSKVRRLVGRAGFTESDRPDLVQEFVLNLLQRGKNFDPSTATWEAFVVVVCENCYATILEHRRAEMRSHKREGGSLNRPIKGTDGKRAEAGATIPDSQHARRTGRHRRSPEEEWELAQDIPVVLDQMPPQMRELCESMMHKSKAAAGRDLGVAQGSLYEILGRVLTRSEKSELHEYLK